MLVKAQYRDVSDKGVKTISFKDDLTLELITVDKSKEGTKKTFLKDGKAIAEKMECRLTRVDSMGNPISGLGSGIGYVIMENGGAWIIPANAVEEVDETISNVSKSSLPSVDATAEVDQYTQQANSILASDKTYFGFTAKQLLIIGIIVVIARKI